MKEFFGKENLSFLINLIKSALRMKMDKDPNLVVSEGEEDSELRVVIDADTVQGHSPSDFVMKHDLDASGVIFEEGSISIDSDVNLVGTYTIRTTDWFSTTTSSTEEPFNEWLESILKNMKNGDMRLVRSTVYPAIGGQMFWGFLSKYSEQVACHFSWTYGYVCLKYKTNGTWGNTQKIFSLTSSILSEKIDEIRG